MLSTSQKPTLIFFSSDSCTPCLTQNIYLEKIESEFQSKLSVEKINVDLKQELAGQLGIFTLPTMALVDRSGQVRQINYGLTTAAKLEKQLENFS